jgi:hypothetical protein
MPLAVGFAASPMSFWDWRAPAISIEEALYKAYITELREINGI